MIRYLKSAFLFHWNLLAFAGAIGFAALSGHADVAIPVVLAGEAAYLGLLAGHPKYQKYVDAQAAKSKRLQHEQTNAQTLEHILRSLPQQLHDRYDQLRFRCQELRKIAADLKQPGRPGHDVPLESLQVEGLDRLLWIYLRLLFTQHSLEKFLDKTSIDRIQNDAERVKNRLESLDPQDQTPHTTKIRRTLEDNLATCQTRIRNYEQARANYEFVELEIDRLENKIKSLAEVAVNRQEPDYVTSQVDQVARSMMETEKTMNDLDFVTGLGHVDDQVPQLLEAPVRIN